MSKCEFNIKNSRLKIVFTWTGRLTRELVAPPRYLFSLAVSKVIPALSQMNDPIPTLPHLLHFTLSSRPNLRPFLIVSLSVSANRPKWRLMATSPLLRSIFFMDPDVSRSRRTCQPSTSCPKWPSSASNARAELSNIAS